MLRVRSEILRRLRRRVMASRAGEGRRRYITELFALLLLLIALNILAMMWFEGLPLGDAVWLTLTTVTTVGYGDQVAVTAAGRIATVVLLYIFGIFLLARIVGEWIDYRLDRWDRMHRGLWSWKMKDHILILNTPDIHGDRYLRLLVEQVRVTPLLGDIPIEVFTPHFPDGLPSDIEGQGVVLRAGAPEESSFDLNEVDVELARHVLLLAVNTNDPRSDSINLDMLDQLATHKLKGHVIVECVLESNRERFKRLGADAVIRPIRAYPELLVQAMSAPGTEAILEDLLVYAGNHPRRYDLPFHEKPWGNLASLLLQKGLGTPLGYLDNDARMITNPPPEVPATGKAIFVMVSQDAADRPDLVQACIEMVDAAPAAD